MVIVLLITKKYSYSEVKILIATEISFIISKTNGEMLKLDSIVY
jgi:hypothetical protein